MNPTETWALRYAPHIEEIVGGEKKGDTAAQGRGWTFLPYLERGQGKIVVPGLLGSYSSKMVGYLG